MECLLLQRAAQRWFSALIPAMEPLVLESWFSTLMIIGIDFDNTIACYDYAFSFAAQDMGLVTGQEVRSKALIKSTLLQRENGACSWMQLQGRVYGYYIGKAVLFAGFPEFVAAARSRGHTLKIISHKTQYGHGDPDRIDLTVAARDWMQQLGFFDPLGLAFNPEDISFHATRAEKINAVSASGCQVFIDDLPEVLMDSAFPDSTRRMLFSPSGDGLGGLSVYPSWDALTVALLP